MRLFFLAAALFFGLAATVAAARPNESRVMLVTAYTSCDASIARFKKCDGITASGKHATWGIAACGRAYAFGTVFEVPDLGFFACYDRGGGVTNDILDVWIPPGKSIGGAKRRPVVVRYDIDAGAVLDGAYSTEEDAHLYAPAEKEEEPTIRMAASQAVGTLKAAAARSNGLEHSLGNRMADILRTQYNADVGLVHNGALNANLPAGEVHAGQVQAVVGADQKPLKLVLRGDQLKRVIEHGLTFDPGSYNWLNVSGLRVVYNADAPEGQRVVQLIHTESGQPIWDGQHYHVVLTDSLYFAEGYTALFELGRGVFTYEPLVNMASKWLAERGPAMPKLEGRIRLAE